MTAAVIASDNPKGVPILIWKVQMSKIKGSNLGVINWHVRMLPVTQG